MSKNDGSTTVRVSFNDAVIEEKGNNEAKLVYVAAIVKKHTYGASRDISIWHPSFQGSAHTHQEAKAKLHGEVAEYEQMLNSGVTALIAHAAEVRQWLDENKADAQEVKDEG